MAEIKLPTMSYKEIGEKGSIYALDEVEYNGLTIRQWADKITGGEYAPVVHGQWLCVDTDTEQFFLCNRCKKKEYWEINYCPHCGAKMDEEVWAQCPKSGETVSAGTL